MDLPEAVLFLAIELKTNADQGKLSQGLEKLMAEDPTFRVETAARASQTIIRGTSELHLDGIVTRLKHEFNVDVAVGKPQVVYKETITQPAEGTGRYVRQIGGEGHYAHVKIRLLPGERRGGYVFESQIVGGRIPTRYIKPIDEGIQQALARGPLGYVVDDVRIELYDGSFHDIDSSEAAFKIAGAMAFQDAARKAKPVLLEPIECRGDGAGRVLGQCHQRHQLAAGLDRGHGAGRRDAGYQGQRAARGDVRLCQLPIADPNAWELFDALQSIRNPQRAGK